VEILNLGGAAESASPAPKSRRKLRVILGIGALAAVTGIGSTLAANISLNGGGNVEFGQGVATTAACDDDITLTPISEFSNTEEDETFAMTAIQISHIDLTPEGWDVNGGGWVQGFHPADETNSYQSFWDENMKEHSGQYYNSQTDVWTNTCDNKSLMLHAYTDQSDYSFATDGGNISSPLLLNGWNNLRPNRNADGGSNPGVGFRHITQSDGSNWYDNYRWDIAYDDGYYGSNTYATYVNISYDGDWWDDDSTVTIGLDDDNYTPPLDSRWVDKLTIESAATTPNGWDSDFPG